MNRCHTYQGVHIPGCMGCAVYGGERHSRQWCTCPAPERATLPDPETLILKELRAIRERLDALELANPAHGRDEG